MCWFSQDVDCMNAAAKKSRQREDSATYQQKKISMSGMWILQSGDTSLPETQRTIIHQAAPAEGGSVWGRSNLALQAAVVDFPGELRAALARSKITAMA